MAFISQERINEIREGINIVDLIGNYVDLTKKGSNYMASCPFHEDNHPSFSVSTDKQIFKCFSCGRGGNIYTFLQEIEGISFQESVIKAAEFAGFSMEGLEYHQTNLDPEKQSLYDIHEISTEFYHHYLMNTKPGQEALNYLLNRGFTTQQLESFKIGLSPENSEILVKVLQDKGFNIKNLVDSGIFYQDDNGSLFDRFNQRIIFPLDGINGQIVGFSGRIYKDSNTHAKYLNSPETKIFNKSQCIYNFNHAKAKAKQIDQLIIVEGYMDVISLDQFGVNNVVATMGTSLTDQHLKAIQKVSKNVIFIFDGDAAGQKASSRAFELLKKFPKLTGKHVLIPNQMDPDEWIKKNGLESFNHLVRHAMSSFDFEKQYIASRYNLEDDRELANYIDELLHLINQLSSPIEKQLRISDLAKDYQISEDILKQQLNRMSAVPIGNPQTQTKVSDSVIENTIQVTPTHDKFIKSPLAYQSEKILLFNLIYYDQAWKYIENLNEPLLLFHEFSQKLYFTLQEYYYDKGYPLPLDGIVDRIDNKKMAQLITTIVWDQLKADYSDKIMSDCIKTIQEAFIHEEISDLRKKLEQYQLENNVNAMNQTMTQMMYLMRKIK